MFREYVHLLLNGFSDQCLPRDVMRSADYAVARCLSVRLFVRLSVTRRYSVETAKHMFKRFSPSGSHAILVFPYRMAR